MKKEKNIDELFREKLLNYEQEPPAYLLDSILAGAAREKKKRALIYWRIVGVAAALLLAFVAGWQFNAREGKITQLKQVASLTKEASSSIKPVSAEKQTAVSSSELPASHPDSGKEQKKTVLRKPNNEKIIAETTGTMVKPEQETIHLLKTVNRITLPNTSESALLMQKKNTENAPIAEKSIDQQIMEQNQQLTTIQLLDKEKGRWLIGLQVSPSYSVSRSNYSRTYSSNMLNTATSNPPEFAGGLSVEYKPGKRWSLQSGVYYSGLGQNSGNAPASGGKDAMYANVGSGYFNAPINYDTQTRNMSMNSTAGVIELKNLPSGIIVGGNIENNDLSTGVVVTNAAFTQNFEYIEIPLFLRYTIVDSRFDVEMLGGFSSNVLVGNQTFIESGNGKSLVGKTKDMETMNYSGTLGVGVKYGLSKHISVNVEPRVKYYLNSLNSNTDVSYKPYTIGVFTGLSYEF